MTPLARALRSPKALLIFEAAARCGSCSAAAREFNLTQPSVSRNISQLESSLGTTLFIRKPTGLELTSDGQILYQGLSDGLHRVDAALRAIDLRNIRSKEVVELSMSTAFVTHWFVPRMREFQHAFPNVDLRFQLISGSLKGTLGNVDLAMRRTEADDTGDRTWPLAPELVLPVCSPAYLAVHGSIDEGPGDRAHVLLQLSDAEIDWSVVSRSTTEASVRQGKWIEFSDYAVVLQAAMGGQGVGLGWVSAISRMLIDKTLVPASARRVGTGRNFSLVAPRGRKIRSIVLEIRDWLMREMRGELTQLAPLIASGQASPDQSARP